MGTAMSSSWVNWYPFAFRCAVSARAAPWANSISVTTETAMSVFPAVREMAMSICRAFCPWRSALIRTWNRGSIPCGWFERFAMALDGCFHVLGEVGIHDRRRVLGKERDALGDGPARRGWRIEHGYRQLAAFDHDFCAGAHARKHIGEVAGGFASEMRITWSALARLYRHS